jgi:hypothetical protein
MTYPSFSAGEVLRAQDMNAVGLWLTGSVTLTGQSTASLNNVFSSDYSSYLLVWDVRASSGSGSLRIQLALNGTPNATASSYVSGGRYVGFPGVGAADFNGAGTFWDGSFFTTFTNTGNLTISRPYDALPTAMTGTYISNNASVFNGGYHNQSTSYNGLYISNSGAVAMYGKISVYGTR